MNLLLTIQALLLPVHIEENGYFELFGRSFVHRNRHLEQITASAQAYEKSVNCFCLKMFKSVKCYDRNRCSRSKDSYHRPPFLPNLSSALSVARVSCVTSLLPASGR